MSLAWLPNAITLSRMVMVLPLWWLLARGEYGWALALAALAGFAVAMPLSYLIASKIAREKATNRVA